MAVEKETERAGKISRKAYLAISLVLIGITFEAAFVKNSYAVLFPSVNRTFSGSFCLAGECSEEENMEVGSVIFWSLTAASEPLGAIPAALTGTPMAHKYGRVSTMLFASVPAMGGLILQGISSSLQNSLLLPMGRLLHSFGSIWLLCAGKAFVMDLLTPMIKPRTIFAALNFCTAASLPIVYGMGLEPVLGEDERWPWVNGVCGGVLLILIILLTVIPEPPKYLLSVSEKIELHHSLSFYTGSPITIEAFKFQILSQNIWGQNGQERSALEKKLQSVALYSTIRKQMKIGQISQVYAVILAETLQTLLMSNALCVFIVASLLSGIGMRRDYANVELLVASSVGIVASFVNLELGKKTKKPWVRVTSACTAIASLVCLTVLGFVNQYYEYKNPFPILDLSVFFCLFLLFAAYNLGLGTLSQDLANTRLPASASGPILSLATSVAKAIEIPTAIAFYPVMRFCGLGYAWLVILIPSLTCFILWLILLREPAEKQSPRIVVSQPDSRPPSTPKIPLLIYPEVKTPGLASSGIHRSASFSSPAPCPGRPGRSEERKKSAPLPRRSHSASPRRKLAQGGLTMNFPLQKEKKQLRNFLDVPAANLGSASSLFLQ